MRFDSCVRVILGAALLTGLCLTIEGELSSAEAQYDPRARPRFGQVRLRTGFMPDPNVLNGMTGGPIQASRAQRGCRGYITREPTHVIRARTAFRNIRFVVSAQRDATLMVALPNGRVLCDDDGGEGMNPLIETSSPRGDIAVWVGSYSANGSSPHQLGVTELSHITASSLQGAGGIGVRPTNPSAGAGGVNPNLPPRFGGVNLNRGFMPDPNILSGVAGGPIQARNLQSGCRGYINPQPDHVVMSRSGFQQIRFVVNSGRLDTTLVVMLPDGRVVCDDDGGAGFNPLVSTASGPGAIKIWVGSYSANGSGPYNLGVSELGSVGTQSIPPPGGVVTAAPPPPVAPVVPPTAAGELVEMIAEVPVTLVGPGMTSNIIANWNARRGPAVPVQLRGSSLVVGGVALEQVPSSLRSPVITVTQRRNRSLVVRAEQPPSGRGDPGQQFLLQVRWQRGAPVITERWSGTARQRGPRWSR